VWAFLLLQSNMTYCILKNQISKVISFGLYRMSYQQKTGQEHSIIANVSFEDVANLKYLGTTLTDQNCIREEIKSRLNSGNASYHSVRSLLSSCLLSMCVKRSLKYTKP
jgi:hypothetical protein